MHLYLGNEGVVVGELVVDGISFQKKFGLCGLKCHIVEICCEQRTTTECEERARILETQFAIQI